MRDGYVVTWQGREYDASPDGDDVRIYQPEPADGFEEVAPGRYVRVLPADEFDEIWCTSAPPAPGGAAVHRAGRGTTTGCGWSTPAAAGPVAQALGLEEFDFGVYQGWAPAHEVADLREHRV